MKIRLATIGVILCLFSLQAMAQSESGWTEVTPAGESFRVSMPTMAADRPWINGSVTGTRYSSSADGSKYIIWSLRVSTIDSLQEVDEYLDFSGDFLWRVLLKPGRDMLSDEDRKLARMNYEKELSGKALPGREYSFVMGNARGAAQIFLAYERMFVLMVLDSPNSPWHRTKFFESFTILPEIQKLQPAPAEPATATKAEGDDERIFTGREVTKKARVLSKSEPTYTESARQFSVTGTVVLRAVFSKDGTVTNLRVVSGLPHGLTRRAIEAARGIRFTPAEVDGRPVSMWMELQYNFNLY